MGKHRRPWWLPGDDNVGSWAPQQEETPEPSTNVAVVPDPKPDEVVLVHDPRTNAPMAVYRRFVRD